MISITNQQLIYPVALILSTTRKTCKAMASVAGKSGDTFCRLLKEKSVTPHDLVNIAKNILTGIFLIFFLLMLSYNLKLKIFSFVFILCPRCSALGNLI